MNEEHARRIAKLRQAYEAGILDEDTYQSSLAALAAQNSPPTANAESSGIAVGKDVNDSTLLSGDNNSVTHIRNIYMQAYGPPQLDESAFNQALDRYLEWVSNRFGQLSLRGIERREQKSLDLTLKDVYVSLVATLSPNRKEKLRVNERGLLRQTAREDAEEHLQPAALGMSRLLALSERLMIVGGPGSGKTTYLHIIASALAQALRSGQNTAVQRDLGLQEPLPLPILVPLSEFNRYRKQLSNSPQPRDGTLIAFISYWLIRQEAAIGLPDDFFERLLRQGHSCILLLDGLDEVANERERAVVVEALKNVANNSGLRQIVVTCRTRAYRDNAVLPEEFRVAEVQPMTPEQVDALAARWCEAAYSPLDAEKESERLQQAIRRMEEVRAKRNENRLIESPLLVTIVAIVHYNQRRLPDERAELYEKCVDVLLAERHHPVSETTFELADWGGSLAEKRNLLAFLAFQMMNAGEQAGRSVSEAQLEAWLRPQLARKRGEAEVDAAVSSFIAAMRERGSLLEERGGDYRFLHLTFQEYLCAYHLAENVRELDRIIDFLAGEGRIGQSWWRETILLVVGYLGLRSQENALALVRRLASCGNDEATAMAASEISAVAFLELDNQNEQVRQELATRLVTALTQKQSKVDDSIRIASGYALGLLDDPRPGVGLRAGMPDIEWCEVQAGPFTMGFRHRKFECSLIKSSFHISRYPITVKQYQTFIDAQGYLQRKWWTEAGWSYLQEKINIRKDMHERFGIPLVLNDLSESSKPWDGLYVDGPNHPRVNVSWYEAVAFCNWISEMTAQTICLPTEFEWERAARHTDKRKYPWGQKYDYWYPYCNSGHVSCTSAVGIFPDGDAVCGASDMSGNVWELCSTKASKDYHYHKNYESKVDSNLNGKYERVARGGSWLYGEDTYTTFCDHVFSPGFQREDTGFRVVRHEPSKGNGL